MHRFSMTGPLPAATRIVLTGVAGFLLALVPAAHSQGSQKAAPSRPAVSAPESAEAAAPSRSSRAVDEKFRKLQEEMARGDRGLTPDPGRDQPAPESVGAVSLSLQILFGLAFVLLLAVFSIRLLKRFQGRLFSRPAKSGGDLLEVMETCHLGQNQRVVALRINDEVGVLGVTPHGISLLTVLKQPAEEISAQRLGNAAAFSDNLNKLLDRFKKPKRVSDLLDDKG